MTKDERFLIELYRFSAQSVDPEKIVNPTQVAKNLGYKVLLLKDVLKGLRQANLIKIYGPEEIIITERGSEVARSLLSG